MKGWMDGGMVYCWFYCQSWMRTRVTAEMRRRRGWRHGGMDGWMDGVLLVSLPDQDEDYHPEWQTGVLCCWPIDAKLM